MTMTVSTKGKYSCVKARINTDVEKRENDPHFNEVYHDIPDGMFLGEVERLLCKMIGRRIGLPSDRIVVNRGIIYGDTILFMGVAENSPVFWELKYRRGV